MGGGDVGQAVADVAGARGPHLRARGHADLAPQRLQELAQGDAMAGGHVDVLAGQAARGQRAQVPWTTSST